MQIFYKIYFAPVDLDSFGHTSIIICMHIHTEQLPFHTHHEQSSFFETDPRVWGSRNASEKKKEKPINEDGSIFYKLTIVLVIDYFYMDFTNEKKKKNMKDTVQIYWEKRPDWWSIYFFISGDIFL